MLQSSEYPYIQQTAQLALYQIYFCVIHFHLFTLIPKVPLQSAGEFLHNTSEFTKRITNGKINPVKITHLLNSNL